MAILGLKSCSEMASSVILVPVPSCDQEKIDFVYFWETFHVQLNLDGQSWLLGMVFIISKWGSSNIIPEMDSHEEQSPVETGDPMVGLDWAAGVVL